MLTKPLMFVLTFMLSIINFVILLLPIAVVGFPIFMFMESLFVVVGANILYFLVSRISFLMILYLVLDFIFGFTVRRLNRGAVPIEKAKLIYGHDEINDTFKWLKKKFNLPNVRLYIAQDFEDINAYAIGSLRKKSVTITLGLIEMIKIRSNSKDQYVDSIKGILGHEMSHLSNKDYLPGLLASANDTANRHISGLIRFLFAIFANLFRFIPFIGRPIYRTIMALYSIVGFFINFFFNWLFMPLYRFTQKWLGRSMEYRCDRESSYAFGGRRMATALSMLGKGSYFSVFSTHPKTKSRIKYVKNIHARPGTIKPSIMNRLANLLSLLLVVAVCAYSTQKTDVPGMYQHYLTQVHYPVKVRAYQYKQDILNLYYKYSR